MALDFLNRLRADTKLFQRADGRDIEVNFVQPDPALSSHIEKLVPAGTGVLHFVDYTARRVKENRELLAATPTKSVPSSLILTLNDDNVGFLPQSSHSSLQELLVELRNHGWSGFSTRYWCVGEIDLSAYLLSRGSFDSSISVEQACRDLVAPVCGDASAECTIKAMNLIEQATVLVDENDIAFSFPIPNVVMKHYASEEPIPEWWGKVREHYLNAMNEMYRANTRARDGGRSYTLYLARRCEFGFEYMNCVEAVRKAGIAKRSKDVATQRAQLEAAIESLNGGLNAMAAVARSNSDRGVIAVLNEYGYRPLVRELDAVDQAASKD